VFGTAVLFGRKRVVGNGDFLALRDGGARLKLVGVETAVGVVVEGDAEVGGGGDAEGHGSEGRGPVGAGGYGGGDGDPGFELDCASRRPLGVHSAPRLAT